MNTLVVLKHIPPIGLAILVLLMFLVSYHLDYSPLISLMSIVNVNVICSGESVDFLAFINVIMFYGYIVVCRVT